MARDLIVSSNPRETRVALLEDGVVSELFLEREAQRGIVDVETLAQVNRQFVDTVNEVLQIQRDGRQRRQAAETELQRIEAELKRTLAQGAAQGGAQGNAPAITQGSARP